MQPAVLNRVEHKACGHAQISQSEEDEWSAGLNEVDGNASEQEVITIPCRCTSRLGIGGVSKKPLR